MSAFQVRCCLPSICVCSNKKSSRSALSFPCFTYIHTSRVILDCRSLELATTPCVLCFIYSPLWPPSLINFAVVFAAVRWYIACIPQPRAPCPGSPFGPSPSAPSAMKTEHIYANFIKSNREPTFFTSTKLTLSWLRICTMVRITSVSKRRDAAPGRDFQALSTTYSFHGAQINMRFSYGWTRMMSNMTRGQSKLKLIPSCEGKNAQHHLSWRRGPGYSNRVWTTHASFASNRTLHKNRPEPEAPSSPWSPKFPVWFVSSSSGP